MTSSIHDNDDEQPLDPALERVQARLRRLMVIAGLTLGVGIFAVFAAILYRIVTLDASSTGEASIPAAISATLKRSGLGLPADARLLTATADGGRIVLTYIHGAGETVVVIDADTLAVTGRVELSAD